MYTDTLKASVLPRQQERYAQVFSTSIRWVRAFPMKNKSDASNALDLLFHRKGVPLKMIMDGSKEQTMLDFQEEMPVSKCSYKTDGALLSVAE